MQLPPRKPTLYELELSKLAAKLQQGEAATIAGMPTQEATRYQLHPLDWTSEILEVPRWQLEWSLADQVAYAAHRWDGTPNPLATMFNGLAAGKNVGVESGVGTGKSVSLALVALWFSACWEGSLVVSAAPKESQLALYMWRWIGYFWPRFQRHYPQARLGKLMLRMDPDGNRRDEWIAVGFVAGVSAGEEVATKAAGFHAKDMLIICEETPGIRRPIMEAFAQTCVAPHNLRLAVGNPDSQQDELHRFCTTTPNCDHVIVSALDHPNVVLKNPRLIEGAVSQASIDEKLAKYGEAGGRYQSRVRGRAPAEASDSLIRRDWCYAARDRGQQLIEKLGLNSLEELLDGRHQLGQWDGPTAVGADVANSTNGDEAASVWGRGAVACLVTSEPCPNSNHFGMLVGLEARRRGVLGDYIGIDSIGVGAGAYNELIGMGLDVQGLVGNAAAEDDGEDESEQFANWRAQAHWRAREDLRFGRVIIPDDEELIEDLVTPKYETRNGVVIIQPKEWFRKHLGRSPNRGDAFIYWNWVRQVRGGATIGGSAISF